MTEPNHLISLIDELDNAAGNLDDTWRVWSEGGASPPPGSPLHAFTSQGWEVADDAAAAKFWTMGSDIAEKLGLRDGRPHLLVNGRVSYGIFVVLKSTQADFIIARRACDRVKFPS